MNGSWLLAAYAAGPVLMAVGAALHSPGTHWKRVALGIVLVVLGSAAAIVAASPSGSFFTINNVLLWSGLALAAWAATGMWPVSRVGSIVTFAGIAVTLLLVHSLLQLGSILTSVAAAVPVTLGLGWAAHVVPGAAPRAIRSSRIPRAAWVLIALGGIPALWLMVTVAGPGAMSIEGWREAPFSDAAETLLASLLLPLTLLLSGAWGPAARGEGWIRRVVAGTRYALLGTSLLIGVVLPLLPDGMLHWRSAYAAIVFLIGVVAAVGAAWPELLSMGSLYLAAVGGIGNWPASLVMATTASLMAGPGAGWPRAARGSLLLAAAIACIAAYPSALGSEVIYSVGAALVVILAIMRTPAGAVQ